MPVDYSFGAFTSVGTTRSRQNLSIDHPQWSPHPIVERLLSIPKYKQAYRDRIAVLMETEFTEEKMNAQIEEAGKFLRPLISLDGERATRRFDAALAGGENRRSDVVLKVFVSKRRKSVSEQLAGLHNGARVAYKLPPALLRRKFAWVGLAAVVSLVFNGVAWLWGIIAGFRGSAVWGLLNIFVYPVTPLAYGFFSRKDLGRRAALMTIYSCGLLVGAIVSRFFLFPRDRFLHFIYTMARLTN